MAATGVRKFWISCRQATGEYGGNTTYYLHATEPEFNYEGYTKCFRAGQSTSACRYSLEVLLGSADKLPRPNECYEYEFKHTETWVP